MNDELDNAGASSNPSNDSQWQHDLITRLAFASLNEQRRTRRWNIFFKSLFMAYLLLLFIMAFVPVDGGSKMSKGMHTALIEVNGLIADNTEASADNIISSLRKAFKDKNTKGIILRINSPGGSPVQAGYVYDEVLRLRELHKDIKVYAVITDMCASGGYYIASSADEIYADKASIVGSIGVLMNSFGFTEAMKKLGIERRLYTAGEHKGFLDPFSKANPADVKHIKTLLGNIHEQFIDVVKEGRGDRLKDDKRLFSGLVWTGEQGVELGLVDGLGSSSYVAREIIQAENIVDYTARPNYLERFADRLGVAMANILAKSINLQ